MELEYSDDILGPKRINYEFLQLVRDKKYSQALILGKQILNQSPDNPSVRKFIDFIQKNTVKLDEMIKQEEQYEQVNSDDDQQQEQQEANGQNKQEKQSQEKDSEDDQDEQKEEVEQPVKVELKIELSTCTLNQIPHICSRNQHEPNGDTMKQQK